MTALPPTAARTQAELEFDRQVDALIATGLPELIDLPEESLRAALESLCDLLPALPSGGAGIPFVVVVPQAPVAGLLAAVHSLGGTGFTTMEPADLARFRSLPELDVPATPYLLLDVDTGQDSCGVAPREVLGRITAAGRTPLTISEGLAVLVSDHGILRSRNCFTLLGSRAGDKRVPALWVSARRPRLGWCYQGAPHTWLGSASCAGRLVPPAP